jgi:hypothetical protein
VVRTNGRGLRRLVDELGPDEAYGLGPQVESLDWQPRPRAVPAQAANRWTSRARR